MLDDDNDDDDVNPRAPSWKMATRQVAAAVNFIFLLPFYLVFSSSSSIFGVLCYGNFSFVWNIKEWISFCACQKRASCDTSH